MPGAESRKSTSSRAKQATERRLPIDAIDRRIVELLFEDGRMSVNQLAEGVNISRSAAYQRLNRLRRDGIIRGFTVRTDPEALGLTVTAIVIIDAEQKAWQKMEKAVKSL